MARLSTYALVLVMFLLKKNKLQLSGDTGAGSKPQFKPLDDHDAKLQQAKKRGANNKWLKTLLHKMTV